MNSISKVLDDFFSSYTPSLSVSLRENRLERMRLLLDHLGHPEKQFISFHIAGSKGKGTVATFLSFFLESMGYKTGLFMSPHVYDIRERFTHASVFFNDEEYLNALNILKKGLEGFTLPLELGSAKPTTFELYTAYGYILFRETGCKYGVIETGLGGRLDATNTLMPIASIITSIEKEHTKILGSTLTQISGEKAGIIKKETPTFILDQSDEVLSVFKKKAKELSSKLYIYKNEDYSRFLKSNFSSYDIRRKDGFFSLFILDKLSLLDKNKVFDTSSPFFSLPGRLERRIINNRLMIFDGAHTPSSTEILAKEIEHISGEKTLIFSSALDKDWVSMGKNLIPLFSHVVISSTGESKKSNPEAIYNDFTSLFPNKEIVLLPEKEKALSYALEHTMIGATIVICGSFYLLEEIDKAIKEMNNGS